MNGHVGIVTGYQRTTSSNAMTIPSGKVVDFYTTGVGTCWRYMYMQLIFVDDNNIEIH